MMLFCMQKKVANYVYTICVYCLLNFTEFEKEQQKKELEKEKQQITGKW